MIKPHEGVHQDAAAQRSYPYLLCASYFRTAPCSSCQRVRRAKHAELVYLRGQRDRAFDARPVLFGDALTISFTERSRSLWFVSLESYPYSLAFHTLASPVSVIRYRLFYFFRQPSTDIILSVSKESNKILRYYLRYDRRRRFFPPSPHRELLTPSSATLSGL